MSSVYTEALLVVQTCGKSNLLLIFTKRTSAKNHAGKAQTHCNQTIQRFRIAEHYSLRRRCPREI